jgi:hypothetical protein
VMVVRNSSSTGRWASSHAETCREGVSLISSERTFVSRMITSLPNPRIANRASRRNLKLNASQGSKTPSYRFREIFGRFPLFLESCVQNFPCFLLH